MGSLRLDCVENVFPSLLAHDVKFITTTTRQFVTKVKSNQFQVKHSSSNHATVIISIYSRTDAVYRHAGKKRRAGYVA